MTRKLNRHIGGQLRLILIVACLSGVVWAQRPDKQGHSDSSHFPLMVSWQEIDEEGNVLRFALKNSSWLRATAWVVEYQARCDGSWRPVGTQRWDPARGEVDIEQSRFVIEPGGERRFESPLTSCGEAASEGARVLVKAGVLSDVSWFGEPQSVREIFLGRWRELEMRRVWLRRLTTAIADAPNDADLAGRLKTLANASAGHNESYPFADLNARSSKGLQYESAIARIFARELAPEKGRLGQESTYSRAESLRQYLMELTESLVAHLPQEYLTNQGSRFEPADNRGGV